MKFLLLLVCSFAVAQPAPVEFRFAHEAMAPGYAKKVVKATSETVFIDDKVVFSSADFAACDLSKTKENGWVLFATMSEAGQKRFNDLTKENIGKRLGVLALDQLWDAPVIKQAIDAERGIMAAFAKMSEKEAKDLKTKLKTSCSSAKQ